MAQAQKLDRILMKFIINFARRLENCLFSEEIWHSWMMDLFLLSVSHSGMVPPSEDCWSLVWFLAPSYCIIRTNYNWVFDSPAWHFVILSYYFLPLSWVESSWVVWVGLDRILSTNRHRAGFYFSLSLRPRSMSQFVRRRRQVRHAPFVSNELVFF